MPQGLLGEEVVGIAFESVVGTYVAPMKWIPIRDESLVKVEGKIYRQNLRANVDRRVGPQGSYHIEGDITFEVTHDVLLYFLYCGRMTPSRTGANPYVYTFVPATTARSTTAASGVTARRSMSVLTGRSGLPFGYSGLIVGQYAFSYDNEVLLCTASMVGLDEAQQTIPAQTWPTSAPYGPAHATVAVPGGGGTRLDIATLSFTINDNASAEQRMDGSRAPTFCRWGEREITLAMEHDLIALTDYNAFLAATNQTAVIDHLRNASTDEVKFTFNNVLYDTYTPGGGGGGQGDLMTASIDMHGTYETTDAVSIAISTPEVIT